MIKLPKPTWLGDIYGHSDATLKQAVRDALERAITTKDQAIAPDAAVPMVPSSIFKVAFPMPAQPPAPDCRTCTYFSNSPGMGKFCLTSSCTNGDQYQPAPAVVLWKA